MTLTEEPCTIEQARLLLDEILTRQVLETGHVIESYLDLDLTLDSPETRRRVSAIHRIVFHPKRGT